MNRKTAACLMLLLLVFFLGGCASQGQDPHPDWDKSWFRIHGDLAAECPEGFALNESNDVLSIAGMYYATWTSGEGKTVKNAQGSDAAVYDAQIYMLVKRNETEAGAQKDVADWMAREKASYETGEEKGVRAAGQEFTVLPLVQSGESNPYHHGIAAFAHRDGDAISVELLCAEDWQPDPEITLQSFLEGLHYASR